MTRTAKTLLDQVLSLEEQERDELVVSLLEALALIDWQDGDESMPEWHRPLLAERIKHMDEHPDARVPADEVHASALRRIRERRA